MALLSGPEGPEPALGFFEKKPGLSHFGRFQATNKTTKVFAQQARGSRERFFVLRYYYTLTLRFRLRYVNVADVTFSFTLRSRSGREARVKRIAARV